MTMGELAVKKIFQLYDKWGNENYIGENVTQLQHAQQVSICVHIIIISWNKNENHLWIQKLLRIG